MTVLIAIILLEQSGQVPVTAQLLKDVTGYRDHTVTDSLRVLTSPTRQIVVRGPGGWRLSEGFQLPLEIQNRDIRGFHPQNRDIRGFEPVNAVNAVIEESQSFFEGINSIKDENRDIRGFEDENRDIRGFEKDENRDIRGFEDENRDIRDYLHSVGIQEPKAGKLAKLSWITREYVSAHVAAIHLETWDHPEGMLIHRLENKYPAPKIDSNQVDPKQAAANWTGHIVGCNCFDCQIIRTEEGRTNSLCPVCRHYHCECPN